MCIPRPGLHVTLGVFDRLYKLLQQDLHELDLNIALKLSKKEHETGTLSNEQLYKYVATLKTAHEIEVRASIKEDEACYPEESTAVLEVTTNDEAAAEELVRQAKQLRKEVEEMVIFNS